MTALHQLTGRLRGAVAPLSPRERRWLGAIVVVGFLLRLAWLLYAKGEPPRQWWISGDQYSYWYYGKELAAGRGYESYITGEPTAYYPIGYPGILAVTFWLAARVGVDDVMLAAGLLHVALGTLTILLVAVIARKVLGSRGGIVAAGIVALFPNLIYQVATLQLETAFIFLCLAALAVIVTHDWGAGPPSRSRLLLFGAALGLSVLVRPFSLWLILGVGAAVLSIRAGWRSAATAMLWPAAVVIVMMAPWTVRNALRMDAFVPSSTNMGDTLCIDRGPGGDGGFRWASHEGCADPTLPEVERNRANTRKAIETVLHDPVQEGIQVVKRARHMFKHDHDGIEAVETLGGGPFLGDGARRVLTTVADSYHFIVLGLAVLGLPIVLRRPWSPPAILFAVTLASLLAIPLLLWGNVRFHVPLLPLLAVSAEAAVQRSAPLAKRLPGRTAA